MKKRNVYLFQVNYKYGNNVFVPYSVGSLIAYCRSIDEVSKNFIFKDPGFLREDPEAVVSKMKKPVVVGFSCYLWNFEYNKKLAKAIKEAYPKSLIVFGGNQVPNSSENFFKTHSYVDILVHGEGEIAFSEILAENLSSQPDYAKISGLSIRISENRTLKTIDRERMSDLSILPSPYLSGVFDFMLKRGFLLNISQETNRGCPYTCKFCDWGGVEHKSMGVFPEERILKEFEWFGKNKTEYLFNCDSNYGIMSRDYDLVLKMVEIRQKFGGYPKKFRMCTAKNSNEKILALTKKLNDVGMNKGATLSFQSMDDHTLEIINRKNIKIDKFSKLMEEYKRAGIATYTELIMGLPGETYESSKNGIDTLIEGQDDSVNIHAYVCVALVNSGMNKPEYKEKYGIKIVRTPIMLAHSTPSEDSVGEYQDIVVGTSSMPVSDWVRTYIFYWAIQCFHSMGLLKHVAIISNKELKICYSQFYESLIEYFKQRSNTLIGREIQKVSEILDRVLNGGRLDVVVPEFGDIQWPLEEASYLNFISNKELFYREIHEFLNCITKESQIKEKEKIVEDIILYESAMIIDHFSATTIISLNYDLYSYFCEDKYQLNLTPNRLTIRVDNDFEGDLVRFAREIVWYGRKGGMYHHTNVLRQYK